MDVEGEGGGIGEGGVGEGGIGAEMDDEVCTYKGSISRDGKGS